jgi:hypothetical protein
MVDPEDRCAPINSVDDRRKTRSPMRTLLKIGAAFAYMVAFLESAIAGAKWWRGEPLVWWEWILVGALPLLLAIYWRYFSVFGCGRGECLLREERKPPPQGQ